MIDHAEKLFMSMTALRHHEKPFLLRIEMGGLQHLSAGRIQAGTETKKKELSFESHSLRATRNTYTTTDLSIRLLRRARQVGYLGGPIFLELARRFLRGHTTRPPGTRPSTNAAKDWEGDAQTESRREKRPKNQTRSFIQHHARLDS